MRFLSLLSLGLLLLQATAQTCSPSSRCKEGCCNRFGNCGFGPDFCGDNCISDCGRKSECNPGYGKKWSERDKCPLNVCCSKHGYCGTTKEFCGDRKVKRKTCSRNYGNRHVVGYFEGWASNRPCNVFTPEQIPIGVYTHINFAFATIDPKTFKIQPAAQSDIGLYKRLMLLKKRDPGLQVWIAIGGWTFNDPGPTATTFSDLAASVPRQRAFIQSLISFMATYGFDGVDLDWEYPVAPDRSGREVDFANFPKFMSRLRDSLDGLKKGISITIPASYWYLQHFDLKALSKTLDFFNIMSYDLHGTWDKGNKWTGAFLNGHTNLTEIDQALDLIWRNDINPDQVVLGMGFYGRAFTVTSPSCIEPGCTFESGGQAGKCSREVGILLNSEIDDLVKKHNVKPKLYGKEAVKVASWGDQWVQYEDEETFIMKSEYAQSRCLGGIMVWAISHDTPDAKYNKAIAKAANRQVLQLPQIDGSDEAFELVDVQNEQCKWTNCGQGCPRGWAHIKREDPGARKGEYMHDQTGCSGDDSHNFCCPTTYELPTCGWYNHRNGKCNSNCPDGMGPVGGNGMYCNNNAWQAACCTLAPTSMKLYKSCSLGVEPYCDQQSSCPPSDHASADTLIAASGSGLGGMTCFIRPTIINRRLSVGGKNKLCSDTSKDKEKWSNCEWSDCSASCPSSKVRVALDTTECKGGGGKARCCTPSYFYSVEVENRKLNEYRNELRKYLDNPTCSKPGSIDAQSLSASGSSNARDLVLKRQSAGSVPGQHKAMEMCIDLLVAAGTASMMKEMGQIWDGFIGDKWPNLKAGRIKRSVKELYEYQAQGPIQVCHDITCSPYSWNSRFGSSQKSDCADGFCQMRPITDDEEYCTNVDGLPLGSASIMSIQASNESQIDTAGRAVARSSLSKRDRVPYSHTLYSPDGTEWVTVRTYLPPYDSAGEWPASDPIYDEIVDYESFDDCGNLRLRHLVLPEEGSERLYEIEHALDGNLIGRFMVDAAAGRLQSGHDSRTPRVAISFFRVNRDAPLPITTAPEIPGGHSPARLFDRLMECLGSKDNRATLMLVFRDINAAKTHLMRMRNPVDEKRWRTEAENVDRADYLLAKLKASIAVIHYLNRAGTPNANGKLATIVNNIGYQLAYAQQLWNKDHPNEQVAILQFWREWVKDLFEVALINQTRKFVEGLIKEMRLAWAPRSGETAKKVLETVEITEAELEHLTIDTSNFH